MRVLMTDAQTLAVDRHEDGSGAHRIVRMWAVRAHARGGPEQLVYELAPRPRPGPTDAVVRVRAAGITPTELSWDSTYETRTGPPRLPTIPSHELSGVIDEIGSEVIDVEVGTEVFALTDFWRDGAAAEYVAVEARDLAPRPRSIDHVHTAALPLSALTAWQALFDHAAVAAGQRVLIHGAAGGVGVFAVQLARWRGASVVGTASGRDQSFLEALGCDDIIDYRTTRFENVVHDVDVALDTVGGETLDRTWQVMRRGSVLISIVGAPSAEAAARYGVRAETFIVQPNRTELIEVARLVDAHTIHAVVRTIIPGKIVLEI
jgi:NADPH:quinone reductase-like Zn-dependent oxidoreductase